MRWAKFGINRKISRSKNDADGSERQQRRMRVDINKKRASPSCSEVANFALRSRRAGRKFFFPYRKSTKIFSPLAEGGKIFSPLAEGGEIFSPLAEGGENFLPARGRREKFSPRSRKAGRHFSPRSPRPTRLN